MMINRISFVGVGRMGAHMARRLKECGYTISSIYDSCRAAATTLAAELDTMPADSLAAVTAASDVVITVVTHDSAQLAVFAQKGDSLLPGQRGRFFLNCATINPSAHVEIARRAASAGARSLECCMAPSILQARSGALYLMCAGDRETFDAVLGVTEKLSASPRYIGHVGQAAKVKVPVNMIMNINTAALAEGLALGHALGLDLTMLREVLFQTGANSQVLKTDGEDMQNRDHSCFFSAAHAAKDSTIAWQLASREGLNLPLAGATKLQFDRMVALGLGGLDKSGIAEITFKNRKG